jgi:hypothetical protein
MSVAELARVIGKAGRLKVSAGSDECWLVPCEVLDARLSWGNTQYQVAPLKLNHDGRELSGSAIWVDCSRVVL